MNPQMFYAQTLTLLATAERDANLFRGMGSGFRHKQENFQPLQLLLWLALVVALVVGFWLLARYVARTEKRHVYRNPHGLFRGLCRAHGLSKRDQRLLKQLAARGDLEFAAQIFLRPDCFVVDSDGPRAQARVGALAQRLFGPLASSGDAQSDQQAGPVAELAGTSG